MTEKNRSVLIWRPLILGVLLGAAGVAVYTKPEVFSAQAWREEIGKGFSIRVDRPANDWPPVELKEDSQWRYLRVEGDTWTTGAAGTFEELSSRYSEPITKEIQIPIFPSVFTPMVFDKLYYDGILKSDIEKGDKVLVIGSGSGADSWVAWLKSEATIYTVDINPMATLNARTTARIANFPLVAVASDITKADLPKDFSNFDFVLWNMPFFEGGKIKAQDFHDGDDGTILEEFLEVLPSLLAPGGSAILLNVENAKETIEENYPKVLIEDDGHVWLFTIPNVTGNA